MPFDHGASRRHRHLLILGKESVAADHVLYRFQDIERFAFRGKNLAGLAEVRFPFPTRDFAIVVGDRRQAKDFPFVGLFSQKAGHIVHMNALHDDDDGAGALVVEARQQRVRKPLICAGAFGFREGVIGLERIIDDDDVSTPAG